MTTAMAKQQQLLLPQQPTATAAATTTTRRQSLLNNEHRRDRIISVIGLVNELLRGIETDRRTDRQREHVVAYGGVLATAGTHLDVVLRRPELPLATPA